MKLIKPSYEIWKEEWPVQKLDMSDSQYRTALLATVYKQIEKCGRTCYKSENLIKEGSAEKFVNRMIENQHYAMLEHGTVYLIVSIDQSNIIARYIDNKYSVIKLIAFGTGEDYCKAYITTNLRVITENHWEDDLQYICAPTEHHEKRITVHFVCNRQVSHEFVRHRVFSFAQESTRQWRQQSVMVA